MSQWTHVIGSLRLYSLDHSNVESRVKEFFGDTWDSNIMPVDTIVPEGSEGSLQYTVQYIGEESEYGKSAICALVSIWGNLRDRGKDGIEKEVYTWILVSLEKALLPGYNRMWLCDLSLVVSIENGNKYLIYKNNDGKLMLKEIK